MIVHVTKTDIARGLQADCAACPIALAVNRVCDPSVIVSVSALDVTFVGPYARHFSELSRRAQRWLERWDDPKVPRSACKPISLRLDIPEWARRSMKRHGGTHETH